tara:strand:- start:382 stop:1812 length:1431 start_codon:yes stop_codon:yes gene_type:complete
MAFADLGLGDAVLNGVTDAGYTEPTPIQEQAIPNVLQGHDLLGSAQTGTGKTASFVLPMLDVLAGGRTRARMPRSLILEPTRELAMQVAENFDIYGAHVKLTKALLIGGLSFGDQDRIIDRGVDVLIATPGRLLDHFERGRLVLSDIKILVIDEADRMLDMGFIPDVERIIGLLPPLRQTLLFSATLLPEIRNLASRFMTNPKEVSVAPPATPVDNIEQGLAIVDADDKREAMRRILADRKVEGALIFCNRKKDVDILHRSMTKHGFNSAALHGDLTQPVRLETLERFKRGEIAFLVASDVAARGLDITELPCVINFDVPTNPEDYVHRIGRTARAGRTGKAFTLATPDDTDFVAAITKLMDLEIPRIEIAEFDNLSFEDSGRKRGARRRRRRRDDGGGTRSSPSQGRNGRRSKGSDSSKKGEPTASPSRRKLRSPSTAEEQTANPEEAVVGMGAHVPAFMRQDLPIKSGRREGDS